LALSNHHSLTRFRKKSLEKPKAVIKGTDNTMVKQKRDRQYNDQTKKGQTIQWSNKKGTDNTMVKQKRDRQYNDQTKKEKKTNNDLKHYTET
jgi:hypothetical protein